MPQRRKKVPHRTVLRAARARRPQVRAPSRSLPSLMRHAANAGVVVFTAIGAFAVFVIFYARDLPSTDGLWTAAKAPRVMLVAIDGAPIPVHGVSLGAPVRLADLPAHVPNAVLAVEDRNFYHHIGINPISVARALAANAEAGEVVQGGSTITQQLAKNLFLSSDRTMKRKIQELLLALWLEHQFTKNEILTLYLNRVYFGSGAYGVDAAARRYFGKSAASLSVGEAAVLAGLLKAPSRYAPTRNPEDAGQRARLVLDAMVDAKFLSEDEARRALSASVRVATPAFASAPYFTDFILQESHRLANGVDADLVIRTTFDPALQAALEMGVIAGGARTSLGDGVQIAAVILDAEGGVRAMVGGRDYGASQFNRATQARRQPGSAFKPFVFLAALEAGLAPDSRVIDAPVKVGDWAPANYNNRYYGEVSLTEALARSLNSATVRVQEQAGRIAVRRAARRMGLTAVTRGPALALGVDAVSPLELAGAYAPFANGGFRVNVHAIDSIRTTDGDSVYRRQAQMADVAASFRSIAELNMMLGEVVRSGTGRAAAISGWTVAGKTGTTQESRDAWFAGHAGGLICVVWVGRDDNKPMDDMTGGGAPAIIWHEAMSRALDAHGVRPRPAAAPDVMTEESDPLAAFLTDGL